MMQTILSFEDRIISEIAFLDKIIVRHPDLLNALHGVNLTMTKTRHYRESVNCMILAEGGMGKTTLCRKLLSDLPRKVLVLPEVEKTILPVCYVEVPSPVTIKNLAAAILEKLGDLNPLSGTLGQMRKRLLILLKNCETRLVMLDEFHHLFDTTGSTTKLNTNAANWIKQLVNDLPKITFCLIGLPAFEPILRSDPQLARRFPMIFKIKPLYVGETASSTLIPFLEEIRNQANAQLKLKSIPSFTSLFVNQIYCAASGNPAATMALIKESLYIGLANNSERSITIDDFAAAWATGITSEFSIVKKNPFRMTRGQLASHIKGAKV